MIPKPPCGGRNAGRIAYYELSPFHCREVDDPERLWFRGGFPPSYLAPDDKRSHDWLNSFIMTYLHRDVPFLGIRIPPRQIGQFWEMLAHLHQGQTWNASKIAANFGLSSPTIKRYLSILEDTYLVRQIYPYAANVKKTTGKNSEGLYQGFRSSLCPFADQIPGKTVWTSDHRRLLRGVGR